MGHLSEALIEKRSQLREELKKQRELISTKRRKDAENQSLSILQSSLPKEGIILSYSSFSHEFATNQLNSWLAKGQRLALPYVKGTDIDTFYVKDPSNQLQLSSWGIPEPNPKLCQKLELNEVALILVPALGFDRNWHRIGYGKGYYDRFLAKVPETPAYGLGFKEQLIIGDLPIAPHDLQLSGLYLF